MKTNTATLRDTLTTLFSELVDGATQDACYVLNRGDPGLLRSLEKLSAEAASELAPTGSSIAAHVDHLRYGLSLMNRWATGEDPWADADWTGSWRKTAVSDAGWKTLRDQLRDETQRWLRALRTPRDVTDVELNGLVGSVAHLAYHLGAIRQMNNVVRGPLAND